MESCMWDSREGSSQPGAHFASGSPCSDGRRRLSRVRHRSAPSPLQGMVGSVGFTRTLAAPSPASVDKRKVYTRLDDPRSLRDPSWRLMTRQASRPICWWRLQKCSRCWNIFGITAMPSANPAKVPHLPHCATDSDSSMSSAWEA